MRDVLDDLVSAWRSGETTGLATVVNTVRSAPRLPGAAMLLMADGTASGSVSGGCVEGAVYETSESVIADGVPELQRYGFSDNEAFAVGLTCGGIIDVFIEPISQTTFPELAGVADDIDNGRPVALATVVEHPDETWLGRRLVVRPDSVEGSLGLERADHAVADDARGLLASGTNQLITYGPEGQRMDSGMNIFVASFQPKPRMIVFGAIDFASAVARQGAMIGYHVTVCDARPVFATKARFKEADEVVVSWPHRYLSREVAAGNVDNRTVICVLTHDPKFDVPVLDIALRLEGSQRPFYIGAMGSRRTHEDRLERLREVGLSDEHFETFRSPIGLDLRGRTPEETAVAVAAEIIALRWDGSGAALSQTSHDIHSDERQPELM